jgi:hypothetical protein
MHVVIERALEVVEKELGSI